MNKLEVAIKLLQLVNERNTINSNVVAKELNVSLRTAQRYLRELSTLPCIVTQENNKDYVIYPDYKLKEALLNFSLCEIAFKKLGGDYSASSINEVLCLVCGKVRDKISNTLVKFDDSDAELAEKLEQLASSIRETLRARKCSFPEQ
jgi:predicted DNA-binding transcriptional regulator YafY